MKKIILGFIFCLISLCSFGQSNIDIVELLSNIEGYVFIGRGETRELYNTFTRTDEIFPGRDTTYIQELDWSSYNPSIVSVSDKGAITGVNFGETLITAIDKGEDIHTIMVFVCPKVEVRTPEGPIFSYHKIYDQPIKVRFSQSSDWNINCVTLKIGDDNYKDVTDLVAEIDENNPDGFMIGEKVTGNLIFTVTLETKGDDETVVNGDPDRVAVYGNTVIISGLEDDEIDISIKDIYGDHVSTVSNTINTVEGETMCELEFSDNGIYFLDIYKNGETEKPYKTYKIIICN